MKTITILTIARSGSSLLAGILQRLGVNMGSEEDLTLGSHLNKFGSHENQDFLNFSVNILFDVGILLDFPKRLTDYEDKMAKTAEKYRPWFHELLEQHSSELWGFKEASLIYYLPYLHDELVNPYYIHLIRDYDSTAKSLLDMITSKNWKPEYYEKIKFFSHKKRFRLYLRILRLLFANRNNRTIEYMREVVVDAHDRITRFLTTRDHLTIHLDELLTNSEEIINAIISFLDISPTKQQVNYALAFIHPELLTK